MAEQGGALAIQGVLETSLYARDLERTAAFYRDLFGFKALVDSPRLVAFEIAERSVLLVFQAGATDEDVVEAGGVIPGHDGRGRLHLALSIKADDVAAWRQSARRTGCGDRRRVSLAARRNEPLHARPRRRIGRVGDAGLVVVSKPGEDGPPPCPNAFCAMRRSGIVCAAASDSRTAALLDPRRSFDPL